MARGLNGEFALEATTINPSRGSDDQPIATPGRRTDEEREAYVRHYLPIKYAGPLTTKLAKEYWNKPPAAGKPLVFAIQDFHDTMSMTYSRSPLATYLYGYTYDAQRDEGGRLIVVPTAIAEHRWNTKVVSSGFFSLPGAENVSAVIFNSGGTILKFNRMGVSAGYSADNVVLVRRGRAWDPDPNASGPVPFMHIVSEGYPETWVEGMDVYHNPNALRLLDPDLLAGAAHHRLIAEGQIETTTPTAWAPLWSLTSIVTFPAEAS